MHQAERREIRQGFGDGFAAAFELVATPAIFGISGWFLDKHLDLVPFPIFTLVLFFVTMAYGVWRLCNNYSDRLVKEAADRRALWEAGERQG